MQPQFNTDLDKRAYARQMREWHQPIVTPEIEQAVSEPLYRPFVANKLAKVPTEFHPAILSEYVARSLDDASQQSNTWLRESIDETFAGNGLSLTASDDDIVHYAESKARIARDLLAAQIFITPKSILSWINKTCENAGIDAPQQKSLVSKIDRIRDAMWWRRRIKKDLMQRREAGAIKIGQVHRHAGLYVSDHQLERHKQNEKRSQRYLESVEMINELGESLDLAEIANGNVSNPAIRFAEMVVRAKGMETYANELEYAGLFVTNTCPSRMHARHGESGRPNKKYDGTTPKQAHQYLNGQWKKARAAFDKEGIRPLFMRIAEPHHDGTPHWHTLVFIKPSDKDKLIAIMRHYALEHDGGERGAQASRFKVEAIDPKKGSAVGYVIKYIAKNVNGKAVGLDYESNDDDAISTITRVTAWARTWGIRQFQFSENCPVTIYRELRKIRTQPAIEAMQPHWSASDKGNFHGFIKAMKFAPMKLWTEPQESSRYPGEIIEVIRGVELNGERLETRTHTWVLRKKDGLAVRLV